MIEVALAMAIIAFGMTSILGLFPVGLNAARAAIADNYGSDVAEQLAAYIKSSAERNTTAFDDIFVTVASTKYLPDFTPPNEVALNSLSNDFREALRTENLTNFPRIGSWQIYRSTANNAIYFVTQGADGSFTYDFAAMIKVWKSPVTARFKNDNIATVNPDNSYTYTGGINLEISWPIEKVYSEREKRYYYIEVTRP
jgi:type II secretory pathway pseudopilin PulG